jgi:hypothetical protein
MPFERSARKFSRAKWERPAFISDSDIPADAITVCLRTQDNKLSLWDCSDDQTSVEETVLALATGPKYDSLEKMHVTTLVISDMESQGLSLANSPGDTAVEDLRERHSEIVNLTLNQLTKFAKLMATNIYTNEHCFLFTRKDVARIIKTAMSQQRLDGQKLNPKLLSQLSNISI